VARLRENPLLTAIIPQRPTPTECRIEREFDFRMERRGGTPTALLVRRVHEVMAGEIADWIVKNCQPYAPPDPIDFERGTFAVRMSLWIDDRGRYENWLPHERAEGKEEGLREGYRAGHRDLARRIPYGFEPDQFYE